MSLILQNWDEDERFFSLLQAMHVFGADPLQPDLLFHEQFLRLIELVHIIKFHHKFLILLNKLWLLWYIHATDYVNLSGISYINSCYCHVARKCILLFSVQ